jgi:hypothetical protein
MLISFATEQEGQEATLMTRIWEVTVSNLGLMRFFLSFFRLSRYSGIVPRLSHDCSLPNPFQYMTIHLSDTVTVSVLRVLFNNQRKRSSSRLLVKFFPTKTGDAYFVCPTRATCSSIHLTLRDHFRNKWGDHSDRAVWGMKCLRLLKHRDRGLESHSRHWCPRFFSVCGVVCE